MPTFLEQIAQKLIKDHRAHLGDTTIIFPNRRAGLFFREYIKQELTGPSWSPKVLSLQDFIARESEVQVADKLYLTFQLYEVYTKIMKTAEGFDKFYYWGQMLLKDFDDVDKYLVNAENLYTNLSRQKQLDLSFDFLLPDQKAIIQKFWQGFDQSKSAQKEKFEFVWDRLFQVYTGFQTALKKKNLAYEGMLYRSMAENIDKLVFENVDGPVIYAGFNALNLAEEKIISWFIRNKNAQIIWDMDAYYLNDKKQEAGNFLREYSTKSVFSSSFEQQVPNYFKNTDKSINIIGVPQHVGQAKVLGQKLGQLLQQDPDLDLRKVAVVLADETLLFPVLHSLPEQVGAINVTMGFPLAYAPVNSLIEHLMDLQKLIKKKSGDPVLFNFKPTLAILNHPLIMVHDAAEIEQLADAIIKDNRVFISKADLIDQPIINAIFKPAGDHLITYLSEILLALHAVSETDSAIEIEYIHHFYQILNRYAQILADNDQKTDIKTFSRLFKQLIRTERLPFTGEPLQGLQIMGVLETRNLDFDHVFVLSMNEDFFPSQGGKHSFIPYNLRKAYELPNYDQQDAIYAYLFYRLLQRAGNIDLFYNTEGNDLGGEEMSRFLQQLIHESGLNIQQQVLANYAELDDNREITVLKDDKVFDSLNRYLSTRSTQPVRRLSPSALNTYLDCRLRFYYRYVADLYEKDDIDEDVDARTLGNVLHHAMEILYQEYITDKGEAIIEKSDIKSLLSGLENAVVKAFRQQFSVNENREFDFEGKNIIAKEIVKDFMKSILILDQKYAPFEFIGAESKFEMDIVLAPPGQNRKNDEITVGLRGTIDRLDRKNGHVRLIDYKTGQDKHSFDGVEELFDRKKKNKAAFQTLYYALLYQYEKLPGDIMVPAVFNKDALFMGEDVLLTDKKKGKVKNAALFLDEYNLNLKELLLEIFDPDIPFDQTDDERLCKFCAYNNICARGK